MTVVPFILRPHGLTIPFRPYELGSIQDDLVISYGGKKVNTPDMGKRPPLVEAFSVPEKPKLLPPSVRAA
jgi:hypothetical protein